MDSSSIIQFINYFIIYAFLGWVTEVIYHAVAQGVIVNRGFLNGPICPIYGFGMLLILYLLIPISDNLIVLFIGGMILTTSIELFGGWILEKLFHMRWWDYSNEPFNLHGYICAKFSMAWGLGVVGVMRIIHPVVENINHFIFSTFLKWLLIPLMILFIIDIAATVTTIMHLQKELRILEHLAKDIRDMSDNITEVIGNRALEADQKYTERKIQAALGKAELKQQTEEKRQLVEKELAQRKAQMQKIYTKLHRHQLWGYGRLLAAYPYAVLSERGIRLKEFIEKHK